MTLNFEVKRVKQSVTQGEAAVYCNGVFIEQFGDDIAIDGKYGVKYADKDGNFTQWGSTNPDANFINAVLFPCEVTRTAYPHDVERRNKALKEAMLKTIGVTSC